jgi:hypothetical protein
MKELEPIDSIKEAVANFQKQIFIEKRPVGVHYRSWVLTADARPIVKDASKKIYLEKMKEALTKDPNTIFYIASDNLDVTNFFQTQFQADQIARYPLDSVERATVEDTQNSLIDWLLLGSADYMIGTYDSTFSESAAVRTNEERLIAIGPVLPGDTLGELFCYNRDGFIDRNNLNPAIICPAYYAN